MSVASDGPARERRANLVLAVAMLAVSIGFGWQAAKLPPSRFDPLGPGSFPLALAGLLGALALLALISAWRGRDLGRAETSMVLGVGGGEPAHGRRPWLAVGAFLAIGGYALILGLTGISFFWASAALIATLGAMMSRRTPKDLLIAVAVGLGMSGFLTLLFGRFLLLSLP